MLLAFPHIFVDPRGEHEYRKGILFSLPPELCDRYRISKYLSIRSPGWHVTEYGYMALCKEDGLGNRYILPGLYANDAAPPRKKFPGYLPVFKMRDVEEYFERYLEREKNIREKSEQDLTNLVHDLRHLSSTIYHSAIEAERAIAAGDKTKSLEDIKTVIASQTMLKVRIDYLDYANSVDRFRDKESIPVYSRVDKVVRCFRAAARYKDIDIKIHGESYRLAYGPNILDIAPYTLIENAIKYSPKSSIIDVHINDVDEFTKVTVASLGPKLEDKERTEIFRRGFRGKNAVRLRGEGTGLGLSVANSVILTFGGEITVEQDADEIIVDEIPFARTQFSFLIPTSGEDSSRRYRAGRRLSASRRITKYERAR